MLSARGIVRWYDGREVLRIDRLDLEPGSATAIVGPNGSGKSTLLRILAAVERADAGTLYLDQRPIVSRADRAHARKLVTLVEQRPLLFRGTVRHNLRYGLALHGIKGTDAARRIADALERLAISALADRPARALSEGELQQAAVARAVALAPRVLLLDEPLSAADRAAVHALHRTLEAIRADGVAVCVASHQIEQAYRWSDRLLSLAGGRLSPVTPENLFRTVLPDGPPARTVSVGPLELTLVTQRSGPVTVVIPPEDILVSRGPLSSSARNQFRGRVTRVSDDGRGTVSVTVDAGVELVARITRRALEELNLSIGADVVLAIKATALRVY